MKGTTHSTTSKRRNVTLSISEDVMRDVRQFGLNASQAAEAGITEALRKAKSEAWRIENKAAIEAYNRKVNERGLAIPPIWEQRR